MKNQYLCGLLASLTIFAVACGSDPATGSENSKISAGPAAGTCEATGGTCVGLSPSSCPNGHFADAENASCGSGVGVACCVADADPAPSTDSGAPTDPTPTDPTPTPSTCEAAGGTCVGLSPSSCTNGHFADATTASCGSGVGVGCCIPDTQRPPAATSCTDIGGTCVGLSPTSCTNGHFADATTASCGSGVGVGCCVPN